jgi:recombination protein RecR
MNSIDKLTEIFARFPGIGPRQAKRFVYYLLSRSQGTIDDLINSISELKKQIFQCNDCFRYYPSTSSGQVLCSVCADDTRDPSLLMVVPRDIDLESIEKSGTYRGFYFVLGGSLPILEKEPEKRVRSKELGVRIKKSPEIKEVILAMNANSEGENTADYIREQLKPFNIKTSVLGRGLSTGAELEYADPETLRNALLNRSTN